MVSGFGGQVFTWRHDDEGCWEREPASGDYCLLDTDHGTWHASLGRTWPREGFSPAEELAVLKAEIQMQRREP